MNLIHNNEHYYPECHVYSDDKYDYAIVNGESLSKYFGSVGGEYESCPVHKIVNSKIEIEGTPWMLELLIKDFEGPKLYKQHEKLKAAGFDIEAYVKVEPDREAVIQEVKDDISPGCHFYEVGSFLLEVCPMDVFVTHESGKSMVFSLKDVETRTHYHKVDLIPETEEQSEYRAHKGACEALIPRLASIDIDLVKIAINHEYSKLHDLLSKRESLALVKQLEKLRREHLKRHMDAVVDYNKSLKRKSAYYKQHAIWSTEDGELEYMFGNGETRKYSVGTLEGDIAEKISHVLTFLDDQSTYERYDRFSDDGTQEFACEFGYGFSCGEGPNIFKVIKSFRHMDKCITIPVSDYEEEVAAWVSEGISEEDLPLLAAGKLPDEEL